MIVAIHQPNFFPWLGYFDKIVRSDVFIFLDHVQYPKKGGSWSNRVKLIDGGEPEWVTAPIDRNYHGFRSYREMKFREDTPWREKVVRSLEFNYSRSPYFVENFDFLAELILTRETNLASYNENAVRRIAGRLGIDTEKLLHSSELRHEGQANEMLISLAGTVSADTYMFGGGADDYQRPELFERAGVTLMAQAFQHPRYDQIHGNWTPGLSIIDTLFNVGADGVRKFLRIG